MWSEQSILNHRFWVRGRRACACGYLRKFALARGRRDVFPNFLETLKKPAALTIRDDFGHRQGLEGMV